MKNPAKAGFFFLAGWIIRNCAQWFPAAVLESSSA